MNNIVWGRIILTSIAGLFLAGCEGRVGEQVNEEIEIAVEAGEKKAAADAFVKDEANQLVESFELAVENGEEKVIEDTPLKRRVDQFIEQTELNIKITHGQGGGSSSYRKKN